MRRIGKSAWLLTLFGLLLPLSGGMAQEVSVNASLSENRVFIGEQFSLRIEVRGDRLSSIGLPQLPEFTGLRLVNPTPSRGQSISIINGNTSTVTTYSYTLIGRSEGTFRIPPVSLTIDGEEYRTETLTVEVLQHRSTAGTGDRRPDIFAEVELDNQQPIVGQQLIASLVIYFREGVEVTSYQPAGGWRTDGFWKEQLENIQQPTTESVIFGGVRYRKATLLRYALFASRPGELLLTPYELHLGIRTQPRRNDPFGSVFGGLGSNQRRLTLETEEIRLPVNRIEAPERGEFISAVGDLQVHRTISVRESYIGEPIELTTTISGIGNLPLISRPAYRLPDSFEIYSPQEEVDLNRRGTTIRGTRTFRDRFVPRVAGTFTLPEVTIPVYNPETASYRYHTLPAITLEIIRDPTVTVAEMNDSVDLRLLTGLTLWQEPNGSLLHKGWFWGGLLLPLLLLAIAWRQKRLATRLQTDHTFARAHHAWDHVEELLLKAEKESRGETPKQAYHLLHKAITGYVTDRTALPAAGLSDTEVCRAVEKRIPGRELAVRMRRMLDKCSGISYAPAASREDVESDIEQTRQLLRELRDLL